MRMQQSRPRLDPCSAGRWCLLETLKWCSPGGWFESCPAEEADFGSVEGDCSFYNESLSPEKHLWRQPDFQEFQHMTALAFPPWPVSTTLLQQHWERSKIPFYMPLSPENLLRVGMSYTKASWTIPLQFHFLLNKHQLWHGWLWFCGYYSALDHILLPNHRLQSPGILMFSTSCHLHLLLIGIPWGHNSSDFLSLVPRFTQTGQTQICAVTQDAGWKVRDSPARELERSVWGGRKHLLSLLHRRSWESFICWKISPITDSSPLQ